MTLTQTVDGVERAQVVLDRNKKWRSLHLIFATAEVPSGKRTRTKTLRRGTVTVHAWDPAEGVAAGLITGDLSLAFRTGSQRQNSEDSK